MPLSTTPPVATAPVTISANVTITPSSQASYNGQVLVFSAAYTVTLGVGLMNGFNFIVNPPVSGNASIASDGTVLLNNALTTLTRALASTPLFAVVQVGDDSYAVTGV